MATESCRLRWPLTSPVFTAAPASTIRFVTWRPCSGSSTMRSFSTTSEMPALRTSTSGAAASTDTVSSRLPTPSTALIVGVAPTCSTMPVWTYVRKPWSDTSSLYGPVGRFGIT